MFIQRICSNHIYMSYLDVSFAASELGYELCAVQHFLAFMLYQVVI